MGKKDIRAAFRKAVFERDHFTCRLCGKKFKPEDCDPAAGQVNAHHITDRSLMPNGGYVVENGITVCEDPCHRLVEEWHVQGYDTKPRELLDHRRYVLLKHTPNYLYKLIGSSYEKAVTASEKLDSK